MSILLSSANNIDTYLCMSSVSTSSTTSPRVNLLNEAPSWRLIWQLEKSKHTLTLQEKIK